MLPQRKTLFYLFLAPLAGCGGCESCFGGTNAHGDAAAPIETVTVEPLTADAGARGSDAAAADGGPDARAADGGDAGRPLLRREDIPALPAVPRPKAPMPMGAMQSCGVYDGPLCKKSCDNGNCRQECEGVACELTCKKGYCSQYCGPSGTCTMSCAGGHCVQVCTRSEGCTKECAGGDCQ